MLVSETECDKKTRDVKFLNGRWQLSWVSDEQCYFSVTLILKWKGISRNISVSSFMILP